MKKINKTSKKTVAKKIQSKSSRQTEIKASIKSSRQTEDKTPIKLAEQTKEKVPIKPLQQTEIKAPIKLARQTKEKVPIKPLQQAEIKAPVKSSPKSNANGIKKQYLKSKPVCKVTFMLPKDAAPDARTVSIAGDFNSWNITQSQMKKMNSGDFTLTIELPCNKEYSFRYLIDAEKWENDWFADKYIPNEYGEDNSVVVV